MEDTRSIPILDKVHFEYRGQIIYAEAIVDGRTIHLSKYVDEIIQGAKDDLYRTVVRRFVQGGIPEELAEAWVKHAASSTVEIDRSTHNRRLSLTIPSLPFRTPTHRWDEEEK